MYTRPSSPLSIGGVIDDAIRLYRSAFSQTWSLGLLNAALAGGVGIFLALTMPGYASARANPARLIALWTPRIAVAYIAITLLSTLLYLALMSRQNAVAQGGRVSFGAALATAIRRLPSMLFGLLLYALGAGLAAIPLIVLSRQATRSTQAAMWLAIAVTVLVIAAVYIFTRLQLWFVMLVAENRGTLGAIGGSWRLLQGHWWRSVTILSVAFVMLVVLSLAIGLIGGGLALFLRGQPNALLMATQSVSIVFNGLIIMPLLTALWLSMYYDLKLRREGGDLAQRVGALTSA